MPILVLLPTLCIMGKLDYPERFVQIERYIVTVVPLRTTLIPPEPKWCTIVKSRMTRIILNYLFVTLLMFLTEYSFGKFLYNHSIL